NHRFAFDHKKLLDLGVVVVVTSRHAGSGSRDKNLPERAALDEFSKRTTRIAVGDEGIRKRIGWQERQVRRVQLMDERIRDVGNKTAGARLPKPSDQRRQFAQRDPVRRERFSLPESAIERRQLADQ